MNKITTHRGLENTVGVASLGFYPRLGKEKYIDCLEIFLKSKREGEDRK